MNRIPLLAFVIAAALAVVLCLCFTLPLAVAGAPAETVKLEHKINPNDAPPESLARLPGIGRTRAQAIVAYREDVQRSGNGNLAFQNCDDLKNVKGIGPVTAKNICDWLKFR
ncbi:MAG: helix-hairpin-helix domain-containing protein [Planctomycetota bacterium]